MSRAKRWVFTLNNYTAAEEAQIASLGNDGATYLVYGREVGESGTPHLQGFVIFTAPLRFTTAKSKLGDRCHIAVSTARLPSQAADYCKKGGDFSEFGELPAEQRGRRTDLDAFFEWSDEFAVNNGRAASDIDIARTHPTIRARYPRIIEIVRARFVPPPLQLGAPRDWQSLLANRLDEDADDRKIIWVVDPAGGVGKSWFVRWYLTNADDAQFLSIGKRDDIAHAVDENKRVFLFDVPRDTLQFLQYPVLEALKNRLLMSTKYNSTVKVLPKTPHIVVFTNEAPDESKMTHDRFEYWDIQDVTF
jgi:hypothetical protein